MVALLAGETAISAKRAELSGKNGLKGLLSNKKTTCIGLFASLGGLVYGCKLMKPLECSEYNLIPIIQTIRECSRKF